MLCEYVQELTDCVVLGCAACCVNAYRNWLTALCLGVQRQVFSALSQIAKHSVDLAEMVVEAEIFPAVLTCLKDPDEYVKKNVATLIREISKHTPEVRCCEHFSQIPIKKLCAHTPVCVFFWVWERRMGRQLDALIVVSAA